MKYCVCIQRFGSLFVEANNELEARDIADHQTTDTVFWSDDWEPVDVSIDDSYCGDYIKEKAFE